MNNLDYISLQQVLYGPPNNNKLNFLRQRQGETAHYFNNEQSVHGAQSMQLYNMFNSDEAIQRSKMLLSQTEGVMNNDVIFDMTPSNYDKVNYNMQRYILSNPFIYRKYNQQSIDGYSGGFIDMNKHNIPRERIDNIHVTSGLVTRTNDVINTTLIRHDNPLSSIEKSSIYKSWRTALNLLNQDIDPTDI